MPTEETPETEDRSELESSVQTALDAMEESDVSEAVEPEATDSPPDSETKSDEPAQEIAGEAETESPEAAEAPVAPKPTLPAAYRRTLKAYDWTEAEIDEAVKSSPNFLATAAKLHANRNKELAAWADAGRKAKQAAPQSQANPFANLSKPDIAALKKKYGDDPILDELLAPVNTTVERLNQILPVLEEAQRGAQRQQLNVLVNRVEGFFGSQELSEYKGLYGDKTKLTPEQITRRNKVLETADAIIAGAKMQNRNLGFDEAMTLAHDATSGDFKATAARDKIVKSVQARANAVTLKPGSKTGNSPSGKPGDKNALVRDTKARLAAVFKD